MQAVVLHHQQPYRRRHVLGRRRASRTVQLPRSAVRGGRAGYSTLPGIRHSQAEEQAHLAQEELQRQSTLGEDEGSDLEAAQYCMKDETHPSGSYRWRWGTLKECQKRRSREELEETVIEEVDDLKKKFKPAAEINSQVLARPGFLAAYNALTADMLGVYRPNLKIVTMVGPPGTGKSFTNQHTLPQGRQGNHRERRHLVRESNVDSHGVRGVRRADSTAEDAQATRSIPYGTRSQGRHEASNVHSGNHHKQHEARWLVQERRARREALRCTPCTLGQARLQQRDEQVLQDMRHLPGACARHGTGCDRHLDRQHSHLVHE